MIYLKSGILFFCLFLLPGKDINAQEDRRVDALLSEADGYINNNDLSQALDVTREALRIYPASMDAIQKQINIYYLMNDDKEASRLVEQALDEHPDEPELLYLRGIINNNRERYAKAIVDFDKAVNIFDDQEAYKAYLGRAISHMNLMEYEQAMSDLSRTIQLNDTIASAYHSRALLNYELMDYHAAIDDFNKVLDHSEGSAVLYFNLGMSYYRLSDNTSACPYFHKACTMGSNNACRMVLMECTKEIPDIP